jgi:4-diphosphocytidyl-2-C-methyl-D-erythritol kinase
MWAIELSDRVILEAGGDGISVACETPGVPPTADNLAWRAADLVRGELGTARGLRIRIEKAIPVAAGLGGGSADAAAVLRGAGPLLGRGLPRRRLRQLAARLGMDVPFFLGGGPALATGRGERLRPARVRGELPLVLVNPGLPLATREVYGRLEPGDLGDGARVRALVRAARDGIPAVARAVVNGLEGPAGRLWPELAEVKAALREAGCLGAVMSGSGPTVVGLAPSRAAARRIRDGLAARPWQVWATQTVSGPALTVEPGAGGPR